MSPALRNASVDGLPCWKLLLIGATVCIIAAIPASAHVHHGWDGTKVDWYRYDRCHDGDCHPVSRLKSLAEGFVMTTENGATLFVRARKARRPYLREPERHPVRPAGGGGYSTPSGII
jgi:hypothetical protein